MSLAEELNQYIRNNGEGIFIEAEARPSRLESFFQEYNSKYTPTISGATDGIIVLEEDANKWGLELRLYLHSAPDFINVTRNTVYRSEYAYRINDVDVIWGMFDLGYRIGLN